MSVSPGSRISSPEPSLILKQEDLVDECQRSRGRRRIAETSVLVMRFNSTGYGGDTAREDMTMYTRAQTERHIVGWVRPRIERTNASILALAQNATGDLFYVGHLNLAPDHVFSLVGLT